MNNIKVSVILCTKNRESLTMQAIQSVLSQSYQNYELIVVDGGSEDNTIASLVDLSKKYEQIKWVSIKSPTYLNAINYALTLTSGEYITFIESDDLWVPNKLQAQVDYLDTNKKVDVVGCTTVFNQQFGIGNTINMLTQKDITTLLKNTEMCEVIHFASCMIRKTAIDKVFKDVKKFTVFFPEFFAGHFGEAFLYTLYINKVKFANINNTLYIYRLGLTPDSISKIYTPDYYNTNIKNKKLIERKKHMLELYTKYITDNE